MLAALRIARRLQACLLMLFVCSVGAAVASPLLGADAGLTLLCSGQGGLKLVDGTADGSGSGPRGAHPHDCLLCPPIGAPAPPEFAVAALELPTDAPGAGGDGTLRNTRRVLRPPARAPPVDNILTHEEAQP